MSRVLETTVDGSSEWLRPIAKQNLSDRAYGDLRAALMRGRLKPGERLRLRPLSARFGISATPMREALLRLVSERALTLDARGTVLVPSLTRPQLLEIRSIRIDLEGRCAARAAEIASPDGVGRLEAINADISECHRTKEFERAVDLNTEFHLEVCGLSALPIAYQIVESLWVRCGPILSHLYDAGLPDWEPHPHVRLIAALRARDPKNAYAAIEEDIVRGGQGLLDHVSEATDPA